MGATFLGNEINATDRDVMGQTKQVQIMLPLKDKNISFKNTTTLFSFRNMFRCFKHHHQPL